MQSWGQGVPDRASDGGPRAQGSGAGHGAYSSVSVEVSQGYCAAVTEISHAPPVGLQVRPEWGSTWVRSSPQQDTRMLCLAAARKDNRVNPPQLIQYNFKGEGSRCAFCTLDDNRAWSCMRCRCCTSRAYCPLTARQKLALNGGPSSLERDLPTCATVPAAGKPWGSALAPQTGKGWAPAPTLMEAGPMGPHHQRCQQTGVRRSGSCHFYCRRHRRRHCCKGRSPLGAMRGSRRHAPSRAWQTRSSLRDM